MFYFGFVFNSLLHIQYSTIFALHKVFFQRVKIFFLRSFVWFPLHTYSIHPISRVFKKKVKIFEDFFSFTFLLDTVENHFLYRSITCMSEPSGKSQHQLGGVLIAIAMAFFALSSSFSSTSQIISSCTWYIILML